MPCLHTITVAILHGIVHAQMLRRVSVVFLAGVVFFWSAGVTVVVPLPREDQAAVHESDEWYPCKGHGCGCTSAEMCRTHCCCRRPDAPPEPAKPSRSDGASEAGHERPGAKAAHAAERGLVIQSSSCSGRNALWVLGCVCPLIRLDLFVLHFRVSPERADVREIAMRDLYTLTPDPPPPRKC